MTDYRAVNRASWDERVPAHAASLDYALERFGEDPEFPSGVVRFDLVFCARAGGCSCAGGIRCSGRWPAHGPTACSWSLLDAGMELTMLVEHDSVPWEALPGRMERVGGGEWRLADRPERLPHSYTLQAVKR